MLLPFAAVYGIFIWLLAGVAPHQWWLQLGCFAVSSYLMVQMNNAHALIRIYSRMVSVTFIFISCAACFLFSSLSGAIVQMLLITSLLLLFTTYQDCHSPGRIYYTFLALGLGTVIHPQLSFFTPLLWLLMAFNLRCLSWSTWAASLLGLLTPYWLWAGWLLLHEDITPLLNHFSALSEFQPSSFDLSLLTLPQKLTFAFVVMLAVIGATHFIRKSYMDKIRIRMLYTCLIWLDLTAVVFLLLQPQHYDLLMRVVIVTTAPLIGHFIALTNTRLTNIFSMVLASLTLALTLFNIVWSI